MGHREGRPYCCLGIWVRGAAQEGVHVAIYEFGHWIFSGGVLFANTEAR